MGSVGLIIPFVIAPGKTVGALLVADQDPGAYYLAAQPFFSAQNAGAFDTTTTTSLLLYQEAPTSAPGIPSLPAFNDTSTANTFYMSMTSLVGSPNWLHVSPKVDEGMFVIIGLDPMCQIPIPGLRWLWFTASMNNHSFQFPMATLLQAHYYDIPGWVYTTDFPNHPPLVFDYTRENNSLRSLTIMQKSTSLKKLKFNFTVQIIFQNTAFNGMENHPMHLHGFNFHMLAQGFGNYNAATDRNKFNYPQKVGRDPVYCQ